MRTGFHSHAHSSAGRSGASAGDAASHYGGAYMGASTSHSVTARSMGGSGVGGASSSGSRHGGVPPLQLQRFDVMLRRPENRECFDCGAKQPRWASTNLGIFFCLRCAGIHRSMGTHISKVKSTNMDAWEESMMLVMEHIGNTRGRLLYEYNMPDTARVTGSTETAIVERAIRTKYERKTYYNPHFDELYGQFMETAIEGVGSATGDAPAAGGVGALAPPPGSNAPPRRVTGANAHQPQQQQQADALEELWGAPVASPSPNSPSPYGSSPAPGKPQTNVAELFSHAYPASGPAGVQPASTAAWGNMVASPSAMSPTPPVHHAGSRGGDWFGAQFGGPASIPLGALSPITPQTPSNPGTTRSNTDDLFTGGGSNNGSSKDEIMSLFGSAPVAGAGGQTAAGAARATTGGYPMAWQPQTVRPYYYPE